MKYLVASDLHGSAAACEKILQAFDREGADRLVLLGDILYHGPRNPLPEGYDPKACCGLLNPRRERITAVRGNCDAAVDQMVLEFPILAEYLLLEAAGHTIFVTHGDVWGPDRLPALPRGSVLLSGHTHVPMNQEREGILCLNPGSPSLPKDGEQRRGYLLLTDTGALFKTLEGEIYDRVNW